MDNNEKQPQAQPQVEYDHPTLPLVKARFPNVKIKATIFRGQYSLIVPNGDTVHKVLQFLRDNPECAYDYLADLTAVDYLDYPVEMPGRFALVYVLKSYKFDRLLIVRTFIDPSCDTSGATVDPALEVDSATDIWAGAEWPEREVFDLFGIRFRNHPDMRRIFTWSKFPAHPLRKDYPLHGRLEREQFNVMQREDA